ncbi:hypothetical protein ACWEWX_15285 [Streptomyces asiaticus]
MTEGSWWVTVVEVRRSKRKSKDLIIQGWKADSETEQKCLETGKIPATEAVVRVPARMVAAIREACDVADGPAIR